MKVTFQDDPTANFEDVITDGDFGPLIGLIRDSRLARIIIGAFLANFKKPSQHPDGVTRMIMFFARPHQSSPSDLDRLCNEMGPHLSALYRRHEPGRVRGAVVEHLVLDAISARYRHNNLDDNVFVILKNGVDYRTPRSIDVVGWDGHLGECYDCKTRSRSFDVDFARNLEANLPAARFKIGLVSTDSEVPMARELREAGYAPASHTTLISLERLWDLAPLQQT